MTGASDPAGPVTCCSDYLTAPLPPETPCVTSGAATWTRGQVLAAAEAVADALREAGAGPGTLVAGVLDNDPSFVPAMFGVWLSGAAVAPLNPLLPGAELDAMLDRLRPHLVMRRAPGEPAGAGEDLARRIEVHRRGGPHQVLEDDAALVLHTSGTTGPPRPIVHTHRSFTSSIESHMGFLGTRQKVRSSPGAPNIVAVPLFLMGGVLNTLLAVRNGRELLLLARFDVEPFVELVERHRIPSVAVTPTMLYMILEAEVEPARLSSLRYVRTGSMPLSPVLAGRFSERFKVPVVNAYGMTETCGEVVGWSREELEHFAATKTGSVGRAHGDVTVRIVGDDGADVAPGEVGELCVQSPYLLRRYLAADTADRFLDEGSLRTGDLARVDEDGFVWIVGRLTDVIVRGGFKILPEEVEEALRRHPQVLDALVAGVPDDRLGEVPHALVVTRGDVQAEALMAFARSELAAYKAPVAVHLAEEIPRSAVGKPLRAEVVRLAVGEGSG